MSKAWPEPRTPSFATHGGNPSAAASAVRQMSPLPTMQMPVRIVPATGAARFGPTTAPDEGDDERDDKDDGDVLGRRLARCACESGPRPL